jgi:F1F0 ATPase subunit 2
MIMMHEGWSLALAALTGIALGALFFGGLWWTVRALPTCPHAGALMLTSLLVRVGGVLAGFYLVAGGHWQRLLACLLGFWLARALTLRMTRPSAPSEGPQHAP